MLDILEKLHEDHVNTATLLDFLEQQLLRGPSATFDTVRDVMHYMTHYPDIFHHPHEDLVFDKLKLHDSAVEETLDRLQSQHIELRNLGSEILQKFIKNPAIDKSAQQLIQKYIKLLREHMNTEESKVFPLARLLLSDKEKSEICAKIKWKEDPLFGKTAEQKYLSLQREIHREQGLSH